MFTANSRYYLRLFDRPKVSIIDYETEYPFTSIFSPRYLEPTRLIRFSTNFLNPKKSIELPYGAVTALDLTGILPRARTFTETFDWRSLFEEQIFEGPRPEHPCMPDEPQIPLARFSPPTILPLPTPPIPLRPRYRSSIWDFIPSVRRRAQRRAEVECRRANEAAHQQWLKSVSEIEAKNADEIETSDRAKAHYEASQLYRDYKAAEAHWHEQNRLLSREYREVLNEWTGAKKRFEECRDRDLKALEKMRVEYFGRSRNGIEQFTSLLLALYPLPQFFPRNVKVHYDEASRILLLDYQLPDFHSIPIFKDGKRLAQRPLVQLQENTLYAITLANLNIVAESDEIGAIDSIVFNGWVHFTDGATGQSREAYILSLHATKAQLTALNIAKLNPEECFRSLKGISAKRVTTYTPVAPLLTLVREDDRLVEGRTVIDGISSSDNLAAMDWQTFEHLVRELFEKEFSTPGMEVRITRASRDRGVDAIVFDPDPIRGGRIVIQAKRYTNTVDVSAVRDLFGTVQSEGANKGILVSTSQFGPDAYEFAKGKPISLLDGSNLLHLLNKHGYDFKIDLDEARQLLGKQSR